MADKELFLAQCRCSEVMGMELNDSTLAALREEIMNLSENERSDFSNSYRQLLCVVSAYLR